MTIVSAFDEQFDEVDGLVLFRVEERICLVDAKSVCTVLHHLHDERSVLDWPLLEFTIIQLRIPCEVPVIHCQDVE